MSIGGRSPKRAAPAKRWRMNHAEAIRVAIEKYEPRLRRVRVTHQAEEGDQRTLVFRVDAVLVGRSGEHRVWYETAFSPSGRFQVSG